MEEQSLNCGEIIHKMDSHFEYSENSNSQKFQIKNVLCIGSGYVGVLTMSVLANYYKGINFNIFDKFQNILDRWTKAGKELKEFNNKNENNFTDTRPKLPIIEKNLENLFLNSFENNLFFINTLSDDIILSTDVVFICVNTPSTTFHKIQTNISIDELEKEINQGIELNMNNVYNSLEEFCERIISSNNLECIFKERILIQKSTVPVETLKKLNLIIKNYFLQNLQKINKLINFENNLKYEIIKNESDLEQFVSKHFKLVNIPEFLAEGSAIKDLIKPDRVILGSLLNNSDSKFASRVIKSFYQKWVDLNKIIELDSNSSELTKLMSNAFLAQRISSINSITELCEMTNSNVNKISESVGMDFRIGNNYLKASMGFGGSCLKKDILSLIFILSSRNLNLQANYWTQVILMNEYQRIRIANQILKFIEKYNKTVTIFGIAFKGNTNDTRGANSTFLISYLLHHNIKINIYDPFVDGRDLINELKLYDNFNFDHNFDDVYNYNEILNKHNIFCHDKMEKSLENSSVLVFCNNHNFFSDLNLDLLFSYMNSNSAIFDLYDIFDLDKLKMTKFKVFKLGEFSDLNI